MKTVLHNLEITWWDTHIRLLDESKFVQTIIPHLRELWLHRKKLASSLSWATLGFPLGVLLGALKYLVQ